MVDNWIATNEQLKHALQYWKDFAFHKGQLALDQVVREIGTSEQPVEARQDYPGRWVLCKIGDKGTQPAIFHTAAVWRWNSDWETGNYVPPGETPPGRLAESRIQTQPGTLCQFSYAVDTQRDDSIWQAQQVFEKYLQDVKGFNKSRKPRRTWQDGSDLTSGVYVFSSQMFFKRTKYSSRREASIKYKLHDWVAKATKETPYFANPSRPCVFDLVDGEVRDIEDCEPPYIKTGDLVWMNFFVEFIIGMNHWSTTFTPYEIIRVGSVSPDLVGNGTFGDNNDFEELRPRLRAGDKFIFSEDFPMGAGASEPIVRITNQAVKRDDTVQIVAVNQSETATSKSANPHAMNSNGPISEGVGAASSNDEREVHKVPERERSVTPLSDWSLTPMSPSSGRTAHENADPTPATVSKRDTISPTRNSIKRAAEDDLTADEDEGGRITRSRKGKARVV